MPPARMPLDPDLLEILRCLKCRGRLRERQTGPGVICEACRLLYPVADGIPNFLIDDAKPLEAAGER
jgi:uncharacterized protein YbaR (Trm112 family)